MLQDMVHNKKYLVHKIPGSGGKWTWNWETKEVRVDLEGDDIEDDQNILDEIFKNHEIPWIFKSS